MIVCPVCKGGVVPKGTFTVEWCPCRRLWVYEGGGDARATRWLWYFKWSREVRPGTKAREIGPGDELSEEEVRARCEAALRERAAQEVLES